MPVRDRTGRHVVGMVTMHANGRALNHAQIVPRPRPSVSAQIVSAALVALGVAFVLCLFLAVIAGPP